MLRLQDAFRTLDWVSIKNKTPAESFDSAGEHPWDPSNQALLALFWAASATSFDLAAVATSDFTRLASAVAASVAALARACSTSLSVGILTLLLVKVGYRPQSE